MIKSIQNKKANKISWASTIIDHCSGVGLSLGKLASCAWAVVDSQWPRDGEQNG